MKRLESDYVVVITVITDSVKDYQFGLQPASYIWWGASHWHSVKASINNKRIRYEFYNG